MPVRDYAAEKGYDPVTFADIFWRRITDGCYIGDS